jgi:aspartyl-tRNA(Asn)/glutamyl-tRNA(Gln) amidotransferase subunit A
VICGHDVRDSTSLDVPPLLSASALHGDLRGLRVGIPAQYRVAELSDAAVAQWQAGVDVLQAAGAEVRASPLRPTSGAEGCVCAMQIVQVSLPHTEAAIGAYYVLATAEAASNLARYDGVRYGRALTLFPPLVPFCGLR